MHDQRSTLSCKDSSSVRRSRPSSTCGEMNGRIREQSPSPARHVKDDNQAFSTIRRSHSPARKPVLNDTSCSNKATARRPPLPRKYQTVDRPPIPPRSESVDRARDTQMLHHRSNSIVDSLSNVKQNSKHLEQNDLCEQFFALSNN